MNRLNMIRFKEFLDRIDRIKRVILTGRLETGPLFKASSKCC